MRNAVDSINIKEIINVANICGSCKYKHLGLIDLSPYHNSIWSPFSSLGISSESNHRTIILSEVRFSSLRISSEPNHRTIILFEVISLAKFNKLGFVPSHLPWCRWTKGPLTLLIFMFLNFFYFFLMFHLSPSIWTISLFHSGITTP